MAKQGFQGIGTDLYSYYEISAGGSTATGLDNDDGDKYKIAVSAAAGANPSGTAQFVIDPAVNGNIDLTPNGAGEVNISKVDIDSGAIDGTTVGAAAASTGVFTQVDSDNIRLDGNTIFSTDLNGDIVLEPDGTGDLKIYNGANNTFIMSCIGECTLPFQPCFGVYAADQANVTGQGVVYQVTWTGGEYFDQGVNFASPIFTAPVTGKYFFYSNLTLDNAIGDDSQLRLQTTAKLWLQGHLNPILARDANHILTLSLAITVSMTAADTAYIAVYVANGAGNTIDIVGANSFFGGYLIA